MKVILILADGMRPDSFTGNEVAQKLLSRAAYTLEGRTVFPPVTLPCHMSLFHSVTPERHGITANTYMPQVRPVDGLFEVLKKNGKRCGHFYDWEELRELSRPGALAHAGYRGGWANGYKMSSDQLTEDLIGYAKTGEMDFGFLFLGHTDSAGHKFGWMSPQYIEAVGDSWNNVQKVIDALGDEYVYIITADHGGHDRTHGSPVEEDMRIPIIILGAGEQGAVLENASILDIAPTITKLFGMAADEQWEGKSLL